MTKMFPGVIANEHVDLEIYRGEVHALLGENGAGKSTLMKILYGFYRADSGEIRLNGQLIQIRSPQDARRFRIGMVFQGFILIPALNVAENIALFLPNLPPILDKVQMIRRIEETSKRYDLQVDPSAPIWRLSVGERQKVEVLKLLLADAQILILDEPTRNLAPHEVEGLFRVFTNLRRDGYAVVFITHKLKEVLACADRITVMQSKQTAKKYSPPCLRTLTNGFTLIRIAAEHPLFAHWMKP
jgi:simple sugar transport system ATP-binding protein